MQDRRLQVVHADRVFDDFEPEVVRAADNMAGADAAAAQPHAEGQPVMVPPATGVLAGRPVLHHRGAPELASPHDQRRIEQAPLLEIGYERGRGPVGREALLLEAGLQFRVVVPSRVDQLHEPHAALDQAPCEQAVAPELRRALLLHAVGIQRGLGLAREVQEFGRGHLHPERQFVRSDACVDFGVAGRHPVHRVQVAERVQPGPLRLRAVARWIREMQDGIARVAERDALVARGQEAARPDAAARIGSAAGVQHHETRQVARLAAEAVGNPCAHRGMPDEGRAAGHHQLARVVVDLVGGHRADDAQVVGAGTRLRQQFGEFDAALSVAVELARTGPDLRVRPNERQFQLLPERVGQRLPVPPAH